MFISDIKKYILSIYKMDKIEKYLDNYSELLEKMSASELSFGPISGECSLDLVDEYDYYGCDFTDNQRMIKIFYLGASNYFPAFWIGTDEYTNNLDEYPIYFIDTSSNEPVLFMGNFKTYMTSLLKDYLSSNNDKDAEKALEELNQFSETIKYKGEYKLISIDD